VPQTPLAVLSVQSDVASAMLPKVLRTRLAVLQVPLVAV
jgi:hypothetical protein